jgi:hypothetical protein
MGRESHQITSKHGKHYRMRMKQVAILRACTRASREQGGDQQLVDVGGKFLDYCPGSYWASDIDAVGFPDWPGIVDEEGAVDGAIVEGLPMARPFCVSG